MGSWLWAKHNTSAHWDLNFGMYKHCTHLILKTFKILQVLWVYNYDIGEPNIIFSTLRLKVSWFNRHLRVPWRNYLQKNLTWNLKYLIYALKIHNIILYLPTLQYSIHTFCLMKIVCYVLHQNAVKLIKVDT